LLFDNQRLFNSFITFQQIGNALLPSPVNGKALPAPAEATSADNSVQNPETIPELKAEATAEPAQEINSIPKPEVKAESLPGFSRPLSPYPAVSSVLTSFKIQKEKSYIPQVYR